MPTTHSHTTDTLTSHRASARRFAKRTADSNTRYREDIQRAKDREQFQTLVGAWCQFITARMFKDRSGTYRPFVLSNMSEDRSVTDTDRIAQRRRIITTVCETATLALNPSFSRNTPTRHRATDSCGVIVLPATTANGCHLHGFIRSPRAHPGAVQVVAAALMIAFKTKNIWVSDVTELQQDGASLAYLADTWKLEERDWSALEFLPAHYFKRLTGNASDQFPQKTHHAVA